MSRSLPKRFNYEAFIHQGRPSARRSGGGKLRQYETDKTSALPRDRARRRGGQLFRHGGSRSLPLARGRQLGGHGRVGRRRERRDAGLPLANSVPRGHPRAADRSVELRQGERPAQARRLVVLHL